MAIVRCIVSDVNVSIEFYRDHFGFELTQQFGPAMAILRLDDLELWLAGPPSSAAKSLPSGEQPAPGGWSRIVLPTVDLPNRVSMLRNAGVHFRTDVITGPGGRQALCEDPSGNPIELFEPRS